MNLFNHLRRRYPKEYAESETMRAAGASTTSSQPAASVAKPKQTTLTQAFQKGTPYEQSKCRAKLEHQIQKVQFFATTSDLWSSRTSEPYLSLTIHYIDNWKLCSATLQATYFPEDHTGELIAQGLRDALESWGLREENMSCMTTDSGTNMVKALQLNSWTRLPCFGHRLHLAIENSAKDHRVVRVTSVCKKVVSAFSFSWKKKRDLAQAQTELKFPQKKLKTESPTRWGSRLAMIERVLEQESAISQVLKADKKTRQLAPSWQDIEVMESVKKALGPLRDFTDALSGEDYVSVSYVKPVLHLLKANLLEQNEEDIELTNTMRTTILNYLTDKYQDPTTDALLDTASLLDPRFESQYIDSDKTEEIQARAVSEIEGLLTTAQHSLPTSTSQSDPGADQPPPKAKKKTLGSLFKNSGATSAAGTTASPTPSIREAVEGEMKAYLSTPHADSEMDPLEWWKVHEGNFPRVSQLAQKYLCIPATSSPSERVFSTGGNIVTCQRATLKPDKVDKLIFLTKNL
ncbi:E3 SUMO-protein ligase ZBED1-like [Odontesthes bonariensis]|uniref:E3 SUMO-protein ligase ZBED1-like n=1 Tax=Odontesthes bonariensis TaxID=219752 RepID=UPI003F586C38